MSIIRHTYSVVETDMTVGSGFRVAERTAWDIVTVLVTNLPLEHFYRIEAMSVETRQYI